MKGESDHWSVIKEIGNKQLVMHVSIKNMPEIADWKNISCNDPSKYHVNIKSDKAIFKIAYSERFAMNDNSVSFIVDSVDDGKTLSCELEGMKKMLGLNSKCTVAIIDQRSQKPEVASPASKVLANDVSSEADKPGKLDNLSKKQIIESKLIMPTF
ncbi:MAG: hypothetical protein ACR5LA_01840 [Wolbachia sp.]